MKTLLLTLSLLHFAHHANAQKRDTFLVYFTLNDSNLNKEAKQRLGVLVKADSLKHGQKLIILGYADYLGDSEYNARLSTTRAKNVQDYLVTSGLDQKDIKICIGKGKIDRAGMTAKTGYQPDRKVDIIIDRAAIQQKQTINRNPWLRKDPNQPPVQLKVNQTFRLDILFENSSSLFARGMQYELELLYGFMIRNKNLCIQIEGHICCTGTDFMVDGLDLNGGGPLSLKRAKAVYDYLVARGIKTERIKYKGLAGKDPVVNPEITEDDRQLNRRVEIRILSL